MFVKSSFCPFWKFGKIVDLLRDGHDRDGPLAVEGRLLAGHEVSRVERGPGAAGGSFEGQHRGAAAD